MNKIILTGRLTKDLELRKINNGLVVASGCLAYDGDRKNKDGEYPTYFIDISILGSSAEYLAKYARKGDLLELSGKLESRTYKNSNDVMVKKYEVFVEYSKILAKKNATTDSIPLTDISEPIEIEEEPASANLENLDLPDDDLPF